MSVAYIDPGRPVNPCAADTVEAIAFEVLMAMNACIVPVSREEVCWVTQQRYKYRTGKHTTLDSVSRMLRGGAASMLATKLQAQGWTIECPEFDGKRQHGRVMLRRVR